MSRIGNAPIELPEGVELNIAQGNLVTAKGSKGELTEQLDPEMQITLEGNVVTISRPTEQKRHKSMHGLTRALLNNMIVGVNEGYKITLEMVGVGFRANNTGQVLELGVGFSHQVMFALPDEVKVSTESAKGQNPKIMLESMDKQLIGQVAAKIRAIRKPEPYKGKGIKFEGEQIRRKAGKAAASA